jgi:hypothetical protein
MSRGWVNIDLRFAFANMAPLAPSPTMNALSELEVGAPGRINLAGPICANVSYPRLPLGLGTGPRRILLRHQVRKHQYLRNRR